MRDIAHWVESAAARLAAADLVIELTAADLMRLLRDGPWAWEAVEHRLTKIAHTLNEHRADIDVHRVALDQMHLDGMRSDGTTIGYDPAIRGATRALPPKDAHGKDICPLRTIEVQIVTMLADGMTTEQIAEATHSAYDSTRSRIASAKAKARCRSGQSTELVAIALRKGWIT